jgi:hypothetical protein
MNNTRRLFPSLVRSEATFFSSAMTVRAEAISAGGALPCSAAIVSTRPSIFAASQLPIFAPGETQVMANKRNRKVKKKHRKRQEGKEVSLRRA